MEMKNVQLWCKLAFHYQCNFFLELSFHCIQIIFILPLCTFHILRIGDDYQRHILVLRKDKDRLSLYLGPEGAKGVRPNGLDF